jgi:tRNA(Ile)-lysidine synthase
MELHQLQKTLQEDCRLLPDQPLLVGVSGGADSLCLLESLHLLGYPLIVAHFDHSLRPDSAADAEQVRREAQLRGTTFVTNRQDVAALARQQHLSIEEAARVARYAFLYDQARQHQAQAIAVAHTADDQVETVLMHLLRGAGMTGLKGMTWRVVHPEWDPDIPLVRPLLGIWRSEIDAFCQQFKLHPLKDPSNADTTFFRNRLRHELIPNLADYNPRIKEVVWRTAQSLAGDHEIIQLATAQAWQTICLRQQAGFVELSAPLLLAQPRGMQRSLMRRGIACLRPLLRDIDYQSVERALDFICQPTATSQMDLIAGLLVWIEDGRIFLAEKDTQVLDAGWPQMPPEVELIVPVPGEMQIGDWRLVTTLLDQVDLPSLSAAMQDRWQAWLDADHLTLHLVVRTRRPGDRFRPLGMDGHSLKLSDFWVNEGLNRRARPTWPLVFSGEELVSVPGFRPAHTFRLTEQTRRVVHLQWFPPPLPAH